MHACMHLCMREKVGLHENTAKRHKRGGRIRSDWNFMYAYKCMCVFFRMWMHICCILTGTPQMYRCGVLSSE